MNKAGCSFKKAMFMKAYAQRKYPFSTNMMIACIMGPFPFALGKFV